MPNHWSTMAEENRANMEILNEKIEELQEQYKQTHAQNLIKKISRLKELRDEAKLNWHLFQKRAVEYDKRRDSN